MMKRYQSIIIVCLVIIISCSCDNESGEKNSGVLSPCLRYKYQEIESEYMNQTMKYDVLTPPNFSPRKEKYNVIYLFHGKNDDNSAWLVKPQSRGNQASLASVMYDAVKNGIISKTVVVLPDGQNTYYIGDWEKYFYEELIPEVERKFSVDGCRERRAIAGLSMGGYGAVYHGLSHPDFFCSVYSMSMAKASDDFAELAEENKERIPDIYVVNGDQDSIVGKSPELFVESMADLGVDCLYESWSGGHDWTFWGQCIPKFITWFGQEFEK